MNDVDTTVPGRGGRMRIPRSRGAASGLLLILLGLWGALIPFIGPSFDFAYNPALGSEWSDARGWLEVLPGAVTVVGGLLLLRSQNRATAMLGGWLTVVAGAWFVVGKLFAPTLGLGELGAPNASTDTKVAWLDLTYFYGIGALIIFLGATALGRLSVRSVRDLRYAQRPVVPDDVVERRTEPVIEPATRHEPLTGSTSTAVPGAATNEPVVEPRRRSWRDRFRRRPTATTTTAR
jgi:hypothetical protein